MEEIEKEKEKTTTLDWQTFNPIKNYQNIYKDLHQKNSEEFFEMLLKKSKVDINKDKELQKIIDKERKEQKYFQKKKTIFLVFIIILAIVDFISLLSSIRFGYKIFSYGDNSKINILCFTFSVISFVIFFILIFYPLLTKFLSYNKKYDALLQSNDNHIAEAKRNLSSLTNLLKDGYRVRLLEKTLPEFEYNKYITSEIASDYTTRCNFEGLFTDSNKSCLDIFSGKLLHYPFFFINELNHKMGTKEYTGSLLITWSETYTDSEGHTRTRLRSQTLYATLEKPCPYFNKEKYLVYLNDAAPNLSFIRSGSHVEKLNEKQLNSLIKRKVKEFSKITESATKKGQNFTRLGNDKFEALWNCTNRNNELEYRLMFSPLAQKYMTEVLLDNKYGFGDDFKFIKKGKINIISAEHMSSILMNNDLFDQYKKLYNLETFKKLFLAENLKFLRDIYLSFLPILSIPIYLNTKPIDVIYKDVIHNQKLSKAEHERIINCLKSKDKIFGHPDLNTESVIKTKFILRDKDTDFLEVNSMGYRITPQLEYVPTLGGDGGIHLVPVQWDLYEEVTKKTNVSITPFKNHEIDEGFESEYSSEMYSKPSPYKKFISASTLLEIINED